MNAIRESLRNFLLNEAQDLGGGVLKVDALLNHQIQPEAMRDIGEAFAERFKDAGVTRVLSAEISGIAPAVMTGLILGAPVVYARKTKPLTMQEPIYRAVAESRTKGGKNELLVAGEFLGAEDRVLVIDDFLARGQTSAALLDLVRQAGAKTVGIGYVFEKAFEGGREYLREKGFADVPVEALVTILSMDADGIQLAD